MKLLLFSLAFLVQLVCGCSMKDVSEPVTSEYVTSSTPPASIYHKTPHCDSPPAGICQFGEVYSKTGLVSCSAAMKSIHAVASKLLLHLSVASGSQTAPLPKIFINCKLPDGKKDTRMGASYFAGSQTIVLDEELIQVCRTFGKDSLAALAFVIGHELSHHFQAIAKPVHTAGPAHLMEPHPTIRSVQKEALADLQGLQFALAAGYRSIPAIFPELMAALYRAYQLPLQIEGYPSLKEPQNTAFRAGF